jgi:hypothetical protein
MIKNCKLFDSRCWVSILPEKWYSLRMQRISATIFIDMEEIKDGESKNEKRYD